MCFLNNNTGIIIVCFLNDNTGISSIVCFLNNITGVSSIVCFLNNNTSINSIVFFLNDNTGIINIGCFQTGFCFLLLELQVLSLYQRFSGRLIFFLKIREQPHCALIFVSKSPTIKFLLNMQHAIYFTLFSIR